MSHTLTMGILNITPDSFADGGKYIAFENALNHAQEMISEGVEIIDIGGESTRPGALRVSEEQEIERTIPLICELSSSGVALSIDTMRSAVAREAIAAGVTYVNDVSGGLADPNMGKLLAQNPSIQYIAMHWRGHSETMQDKAIYTDVVKEVKEELEQRVESLLGDGMNLDQIIIDPGIGFAKTAEHNWEILRNIDRFELLGFPILVGASRKRFLGELIGTPSPDDRESATIALTTYLASKGIWGVRVHGVRAHREAIAVMEELMK
jgi:dihydropteroate synthase